MSNGSDKTRIARLRQYWEAANSKALLSEDRSQFVTDFGAEIKPVYTPEDISAQGFDFEQDVGFPGQFPYTRGNTPLMYRESMWRIAQYAGFATAQESNRLFKSLMSRGQDELSLAFDLPTQLGYDPDHPLSRSEVGKVGISLSSLRDWEVIFDGIEMDKVYVYSVSNAQAAVTIAMHLIQAQRQGADLKTLRGGMQNDVLKEYVARGNFIFPIEAGMRLAVDTLVYCAEHMPEFWTMNIGGYHIAEAGANSVHEASFSLAIALAYLDAVQERGVDVSKVASKISFLMCPNHNRFFEEIGKFRAARRLWARTLKERYGITDPNCLIFRLYTHQGGTTLTKQEPVTNISRSAISAMIGALSGTQNICLRTMDEGLGIPTEDATGICIRSQQVIAYETGVTKTTDPLGGSYYVEWLTNEYETRISEELKKIDGLGGMPEAIRNGYVQRVISQDALKQQRDIENGDLVFVGRNKFVEENGDQEKRAYYKADPAVEEMRRSEVEYVRASRDSEAVARALKQLRIKAQEPASKDNNLMEPIVEAVRVYATMGEICDILRGVFGTYTENKVV